MIKKVATDKAPAAIGPYSQAVIAGKMLYASGQIPINPETGNVEAEGIEAQTEQVMKNIGAVLAAGDCSYKDVVKTTIFLTNMSDFDAVNQIYANTFGEHKPARSTIEVSKLPKGALVEIELIAKAY